MSIEVDVQCSAGLDSVEEACDRPPPSIPAVSLIQRWVEAALSGRRDEAELTVRIVDSTEMSQLNSTYRHKEGTTNVLSFPYENPQGVELPLLGDIVICAEVVEYEAADQRKSATAHWAHIVVHGLLHLLGYDHHHDDAAQEMESLESDILASLGFPCPYTHIEQKEELQ